MLSSKFHNNLRHFPMHPLHIQHPCRNPMVETALDKLHPDKHSCIVFPDIISVIFAESYGSFHLLILSLAVLRLLFKHHKDFSSNNLHLLDSSPAGLPGIRYGIACFLSLVSELNFPLLFIWL